MNLPVIWVISSDPEIRRLITINLKKRGLHILDATPEADILLPGPEPQLIILDLNALEEPEWKIACRLREQHGTNGTTLILLLSKAPTTRFLSLLQPVRWLEKPLDMKALLSLIRLSMARDNPLAE